MRYSRPSSFKSDPTHLRLALPQGRVTVGVQDILDREAVYLPESGVFLCSADKPIALAAYRAKIAGRKTVLEEVRHCRTRRWRRRWRRRTMQLSVRAR